MALELDDRGKSVKLSEVLTEIGVTEKTVLVRRKCTLVGESVSNLCKVFVDDYVRVYCFGSQSEGSTTPGLNSDVDGLFCHIDIHVIQDWAQWKHGVYNLLIVQDESTSPGYCLLQLLRRDLPQAATNVLSSEFKNDDNGRILYKNTNFKLFGVGAQYNGPAISLENVPGMKPLDYVPSLYCASWPVEARGWLERHGVGNWPSVEIKRRAISKGCFLVPVSSKCNNLIDVEWRISTSMAERLLMFDLNITQIHCYILMKYISKTYLKMNGQTLITSFMCKCTLFYCIENTPDGHWSVENLFPCVLNCIIMLHERVLNLDCPHYIIPTNNLMANRINAEQQRHLLSVLDRLIRQDIHMFSSIEIDEFGERFQDKMNNRISRPMQILPEVGVAVEGYSGLFARTHELMRRNILEQVSKYGIVKMAALLFNGLQKLQTSFQNLNDVEIEAIGYIVPRLCTCIGSALAAFSMCTNHTVSPEAVVWFNKGLDSDVSSSRLKLASAFYCAGDILNAELMLNTIEQRYHNHVIPVCKCYPLKKSPFPPEWYIQLPRNNYTMNEYISCCVVFVRTELPFIPCELRHELSRSTDEELRERSPFDSSWMPYAVVDSLPYLYFLQYKVYKQQRRQQDQKRALGNLLKTILNVPDLGHRDTAWNLLGLCLEQENLREYALWCYNNSLELRRHNNAANFHKARLCGVRYN